MVLDRKRRKAWDTGRSCLTLSPVARSKQALLNSFLFSEGKKNYGPRYLFTCRWKCNGRDSMFSWKWKSRRTEGAGWVSGRGDHFDSLSSRHCTWTAIRSTRLLITRILKKQPRLVFIMQNTNYLEENGRGTEVLRVYNHYANVRNCRTYFILWTDKTLSTWKNNLCMYSNEKLE